MFDNGQPLGGNWSNGNFKLDSNLYWDVTGEPFLFSGYDLEEWQEEGQDLASVVRDPLFVDARGHDFRLLEQSPVKDYGIDPAEILDTVGLYGSAAWCDRPKLVEHRQVDAEMKPPREARRPSNRKAIIQDFDGLSVGDKVDFASTSGADTDASIRVTDELAASGKHSLKFIDAEGLEYNWQPHLSASMMWKKGVVRGSFDVYLKPGAVFWHEWRDRRSPYRVGPSMRFRGDGQLEVSTRDGKDESVRKVIAAFPLECWVHVEITCPVGKAQTGAYELALTVPGKARETFELKTGSKDWSTCECMVFVSEATHRTVFYLDNLCFKRAKE